MRRFDLAKSVYASILHTVGMTKGAALVDTYLAADVTGFTVLGSNNGNDYLLGTVLAVAADLDIAVAQ